MIPIKHQDEKDLWTKIIPTYGVIIVGILFLVMSRWQTKSKDDTVVIIPTQTGNVQTGSSNSSGVIVEINTGSTITGGIDTGSTIDTPPDDVRSYMDYIIDNGIAGQDYIIVNPPKPPIIRSSDKQENNAVMFSYLNKTKVIFTIPQTTKRGYVMFITNKEVPETRDFFLSIDGGSKGPMRKRGSLPVANENEYLYPMNAVAMISSNGRYSYNLYENISDNNKLRLNAFVGEQGNYVKQIIIFFK